MTRTFKARSRRGDRAPITFDVEYDVEVRRPIELRSRNRETGEITVTTSSQLVTETRVETFTCTGELSMLAMSEMASYFDVAIEDLDPAGLAVFRQILAGAIGNPVEYQRFLRFSTAHLDNEDLMDIIGGLVEDFTNRPFDQRSSSPGQPWTTGDDSKVITLPSGVRIATEAASGT